jgi:alkanesulfonate monooxygenase SsuD/methylene tetrahydromethanopterin reductase-like flavin-dependent oxidoreductase (luciferase family)
MELKYGLAADGDSSPGILNEMAIKGEELGFDCFLVTDHFMKGSLDAWTYLPYLAALTKKIRLGTCVTPIPLRPPAILAKSISTLDNLSGGRTILGAGIGWHKPEFEGYSRWLDTSGRIAETQEGLELMKKLWTEDRPVSYAGAYVKVAGAIADPKPVQKPHPPIWFGAHGKKTLGLTAKFGDGWIPIGPRWAGSLFPTPEAYAVMKKGILTGLKDRYEYSDPHRFVFSMLINYTDDMNVLRKEVKEYLAAGLNYFILGMADQKDNCAGKIQQVKEQVIDTL